MKKRKGWDEENGDQQEGQEMLEIEPSQDNASFHQCVDAIEWKEEEQPYFPSTLAVTADHTQEFNFDLFLMDELKLLWEIRARSGNGQNDDGVQEQEVVFQSKTEAAAYCRQQLAGWRVEERAESGVHRLSDPGINKMALFTSDGHMVAGLRSGRTEWDKHLSLVRLHG